jgi:serine/threonine-protein kinase
MQTAGEPTIPLSAETHQQLVDLFLQWEATGPDAGPAAREYFAASPLVSSRPELLGVLLGWCQVVEGFRAFTADEQELPQISGYDVQAAVGRGGMGVVYRALDLSLGRQVAIKLLAGPAQAMEQTVARFRREARTLASFSHPHVVSIYRDGQEGDRPFFVMEYLPNGGLDRRWAGRPQPGREVAAMVRTIALAVQAVHGAQVIHRDLKPSNILLTADGQPKVSDLGLAKPLDDPNQLTLSGLVGTPQYMAPEQATGGMPDARTDVYGLGGILYTGLTGQTLWQDRSLTEVLDAIRHQPPQRPGALVAGIDPALEDICLKCLEKDPQRRYASARQLADDLGRYLDGEQVAAPGRWRRAARLTRRRLLGGAAAATALAGYGVWARAQSEVPEPPELKPFAPFDNFEATLRKLQYTRSGQAELTKVGFGSLAELNKWGNLVGVPRQNSQATLDGGLVRLYRGGLLVSREVYRDPVAVRFQWCWMKAEAPYHEQLIVSFHTEGRPTQLNLPKTEEEKKEKSWEELYELHDGVAAIVSPSENQVSVGVRATREELLRDPFAKPLGETAKNLPEMARRTWHQACFLDLPDKAYVWLGDLIDPRTM